MTKYKTLILFIFLFILSFANINAYEVGFGWSLGTLWAYYDFSNNRFNGDIEILHFNWIFNRIILGFNAITFYIIPDEGINSQYTVLPIEIAYVPFNYRINDILQLWFSVYGKTGWHQINKNDKIQNTFFGSIGSEFSLRTRPSYINIPGIGTTYLRMFSLYIDYNVFNKFKIGFNADMTAFFYLLFRSGYRLSSNALKTVIFPRIPRTPSAFSAMRYSEYQDHSTADHGDNINFFHIDYVSDTLNIQKSKIRSVIKDTYDYSFAQHVALLRKFKQVEGMTPGKYRSVNKTISN